MCCQLCDELIHFANLTSARYPGSMFNEDFSSCNWFWIEDPSAFEDQSYTQFSVQFAVVILMEKYVKSNYIKACV